jgi:hypothetical protein
MAKVVGQADFFQEDPAYLFMIHYPIVILYSLLYTHIAYSQV